MGLLLLVKLKSITLILLEFPVSQYVDRLFLIFNRINPVARFCVTGSENFDHGRVFHSVKGQAFAASEIASS